MIRRPPRSTRTDTLFPTRRSSDLPDHLRGRIEGPESAAHRLPAPPDFILRRQPADAGAQLSRSVDDLVPAQSGTDRSEEHTSELQSLMRISSAVFCLKKKLQDKRDQIQ